jgi:hypothetical protein
MMPIMTSSIFLDSAALSSFSSTITAIREFYSPLRIPRRQTIASALNLVEMELLDSIQHNAPEGWAQM